MALTLILALILAPGAAADNCVSSTAWTKRDEPRKDCAWVGRLPEKRCDVRGAAPAGSDAAYLLARDACPAECDPSCAPEWGGRPRAPPGPLHPGDAVAGPGRRALGAPALFADAPEL